MHTIITQNLNLSDKVLELNMLMHSLIDFVLVGRHLFLRAAIQDIDLVGTKTDGGTTTVHGSKTTTQDDHPFANVGRLTVISLCQQFDTILDPLEIRTWNDFVVGATQGIGNITTSSQINCIVVLDQLCHLDVASNSGVVLHLDAQVGHVFVTFFACDSARQTPDGDAIDHDATAGYAAIGTAPGYCHHCHTGLCPVGVTTQDPELERRLDPEVGARWMTNYLKALTMELTALARACGKSNVHHLEPDDLVALTIEAAAMAKVPLAGTDWIPGTS